MKLLILLAMLTSCAAHPQNLLGKMFTFPQETSTAHVRLTTSRQNLNAVTVCLRSFTDLKRDHSLFSLATPSKFNDFLIFKMSTSDSFDLSARDFSAGFDGLEFKQNTWHSICATWDATSGLTQLWLDGKPSSRKFTSLGSINGPIIIVLGQDQDSYGGDFDVNQSFVGMMSDVYMWNNVLSPCDIQSYVDDLNFPLGNVLNWKELSFQIIGKVLIEEKQKLCW
ncbi:C-reactive protein-like [Leuresthes tenuis]|uniref:C-reactive protein-like n=1 Tax=Leuresthes tenuis TaxID=355514 RepID=UPI003B511233